MAWKIAAPALSLASGLYATEQNVTVTCADPDAVIHYTVDGSEPGDDAAVIASGGTLPITVSTILKVRASKPGAVWSELTIGSYELKVATPIVVPPSGAYAVPQAVTATTSTSGATFTFTTDTTEPEPSSTPYTGAIAVAGTRTIKVRGYRPGWTPSDSAAASYWIVSGTASTPVLAPGGGSFSGLVLVSITAGADETIRYTTDGSDPGVASPLYAHPFVLRTSTVVKARAFRGNYAPGAVASATYAFSAEAASPRPSIVPGGGRFATAQTVHVTAPANATIRYTTNGLDPADTDPEVPASGDVIVARSVILKVRAWSSGGIPSTVSRADFIITGAVASGYQHHLALTAAGEVWAWGNPWQHAVGDGSGPLGGPDVPPVVVLSNAVGVSACYSSSLAVKADGTVWNWGTTFSGQIGRLPVQVPGLADVVAVATGRYHALALERDGTVWAWGSNTSGELGDGSTTSRGTPAPVPGLSGVTSIAVGDHFSLAVQGDGAAGGAVWAWGANDTGQLGDGSVVRRFVPVRVIGLETATAVAAGASFALARLSDGTVRAWGADDHLQLGDSVAATTTVPVAIDGLAHVVAIAAGVNHALAVDDEGRVWGWGTTGAGQLGQTEYSSTTGVGAPLRLPFLAGAAGLGAGTSDSLVLRFDGTFWHSVTGGAPALTLADNATLFEDADRDGLVGWQEHLAGTDALNADTNGNGLSNLVDVRRRSQAANPDSDADGVPDLVELASGTNPFAADTDGDGVNDLLDAFPLDPTRTQLPPPVPGDTTPPTITLTLPTNARPIGGGL